MANARKILIVDDDTDLRDTLVEQLSLHDEFEASAQAGAPNHREGAHGRVEDRAEEVVKTAQHFRGLLGKVLLDAGPEGEVPALAFEHDGLQVPVQRRLAEERGEFHDQRRIQHVALRSSEGHPPHRPRLQNRGLYERTACGHETSSMSSSS